MYNSRWCAKLTWLFCVNVIATDKLLPSPHLLHLNQHQQQSKLLQSQHYQPHGVQYVQAVVTHNELYYVYISDQDNYYNKPTNTEFTRKTLLTILKKILFMDAYVFVLNTYMHQINCLFMHKHGYSMCTQNVHSLSHVFQAFVISTGGRNDVFRSQYCAIQAKLLSS